LFHEILFDYYFLGGYLVEPWQTDLVGLGG